jgi:hypothetical protein
VKFPKPPHEHVDQRARVKVVGVDFVENNHLSGQPKLTDEKVLRRYDSQQSLVNRAHAERCQQHIDPRLANCLHGSHLEAIGLPDFRKQAAESVQWPRRHSVPAELRRSRPSQPSAFFFPRFSQENTLAFDPAVVCAEGSLYRVLADFCVVASCRAASVEAFGGSNLCRYTGSSSSSASATHPTFRQ